MDHQEAVQLSRRFTATLAKFSKDNGLHPQDLLSLLVHNVEMLGAALLEVQFDPRPSDVDRVLAESQLNALIKETLEEQQ